jgi:hypothetical protein
MEASHSIVNGSSDSDTDPQPPALNELQVDSSRVCEERPWFNLLSSFLANFYRWWWHRTKDIYRHVSWAEVSGSCGDLGTFIPLFVALAQQRVIHASAALWFAGLANFITGYTWDLPMPVQPMKAIAAVALIDELSLRQVTTAGIWMGAFLTILGATNGIELVHRVVPRSVVSGMQLGVGLSLMVHGWTWITELSWWDLDGRWLAVVCFVTSYWGLRSIHSDSVETNGLRSAQERPLRPIGLFLFGLGALLAVFGLLSTTTTGGSQPLPGWSTAPIATLAIRGTNWNDWSTGFWQGALPQLPLTTLNSVISLCCLASTLYVPDSLIEAESHPIAASSILSPRKVCWSVGLLNFLLCPFGAMPSCHGAGGLAGQHKFGARHGTSVVILGSVKMSLTLILGTWLVPFLDRIPLSVLSVSIIVAGQELAATGILLLSKPMTNVPNTSSNLHCDLGMLRVDLATCLCTTSVILGLKKTHYGALCGLLVHVIYGPGWALFRRVESTASPGVYSPLDQWNSTSARQPEPSVEE